MRVGITVPDAKRSGRPGHASGAPRLNERDLVTVTLAAQVANPLGRGSAYRVSHDGVARVLPWSGGIAVNQRIGDRCVGLAADHIEPGASLRNNDRETKGGRGAANVALMTYACAGNRVRVASGPMRGARGLITGKHGGVDHVIADFDDRILARLQVGDRVQLWTRGLGLRLLDHHDIDVMNCSPHLLRRWGVRSAPPRLHVPVTHVVPASVMGSGVGRPDAVRGDVDIQLFDPDVRRRYRLDTLRFGDIVAITDFDTRLGRAHLGGAITIALIVHGDSTISGHGPGAMSLLTCRTGQLRPHLDPAANLAAILRVRPLARQSAHRPLIARASAPRRRTVPPATSPSRRML